MVESETSGLTEEVMLEAVKFGYNLKAYNRSQDKADKEPKK